jgi:cell division ATPase FtsA
MARFLAIDWDNTEARFAIADARGGSLSFEAAGALALPEKPATAAARAEIGELLRAELAGKAGRSATLVSIDRSYVELASLTLPPASDAELPEMVRNLSMRENNAIAEDSVLDFVPLGDKPTEARKVTAVALSQSRLQQVQSIVEGAGLSAQSITLRPYATAALISGSLADRNETCLAVHVLTDEVDLLVLSSGQLAYWRTLRLSNASQDEGAARRLLAEIQRTLVVAQPNLDGHRVGTAYLCGGLDEHPALFSVLGEGLSLPVALVDPFGRHGGLPATVAHPGRFAPLVGMLSAQANGDPHIVDFLHPRKTPAPPDRRRMLVLAGAAVGLVVLLGGYRAWSQFSAADGQIAELTAELDRLDEQIKQTEQKQKVIAAIDAWSQKDVNWLDELRDLSLRFPSGRDAVVLRMGLSHGRDGGGAIDLVGIVRDPVVVGHIENQLRDEHHQISSRHMQEQSQDEDYTWHFESSLIVTPRKRDQYVSHLPPEMRPAEPPAPADNAQSTKAQSTKAQSTKAQSTKAQSGDAKSPKAVKP